LSYSLGVDLGTSYTAAAIAREGRVEIANLGNQSATIPSVVLLKEDHTVLTGDAANRRGVTEPDRVAREFKRRVGDSAPILLGGAPQSAETLMAHLLRWVADEVAAREGGPAEHLAICHPANWGQYKQDLLAQAVRIAELGSATFLTEPEAAAIHYASNQRVGPGEIVAVYDLGGGTFDAAVLRKTDDGFEILGKPEGIERLGGMDFDAAVFAHVERSLGGRLAELDPGDPTAAAALARLRNECVDAKEALSTDTDVSIQVLLPNVQTEVGLTRAEFEMMIRPSLTDSIGAMRRALASASVEPEQVQTVLLVGGSSRIPLVAEIVGNELGRPVAVDAHPKHAVALGAAMAALAASDTGATAPVVVVPPREPITEPTPDPMATTAMATAPIVAAAAMSPTDQFAATPTEVVAATPTEFAPPPAAEPSDRSTRTKAIVGIAAAVVILGGIGAALALAGGDDTAPAAATQPSVSTPTTVTTIPGAATTTPTEPAPTDAPTTSAPAPPPDEAAAQAAVAAVADDTFSTVQLAFSGRTATITGLAFDQAARDAIVTAASVPGTDAVDDQMVLQAAELQCTDAIRAKPNWVCLREASWDGSAVTATYVGSPDFGAAPWDNADIHLHIFGNNVPVVGAGTPGPLSDGSGTWTVWDDPSNFTGTLAGIGSPDGVPEMLCGRVATSTHTLESLDGGNCWPITATG
jgi:actin-like ATPase involved in cell morphogenesis